MGNSSQRSCLSLLPWPLGSTLKLRCSHRRHWVTVTLTLANSRRLDAYGKDSKGQSGLCHEAGQAHSPWVFQVHSSMLVSYILPLVFTPYPEPCPNPTPAPPQPRRSPTQAPFCPSPALPCRSPESSPSPESPRQRRLSHTLPPTLLLPPPSLSSTRPLTSWSSSRSCFRPQVLRLLLA